MQRIGQSRFDRLRAECRLPEVTHALRAPRVCACAALCWIALMIAACAEGGESEGKVSSRIVEPKTPGSISFAATALGLKAVIEIKVKPLAVKPGDDLLLRIELAETDAFKAEGVAGPKLAGGTVAFFPPARVGEERSFVVPLDKGTRSAAKATSLTAIVTVLAANPGRPIDGVKLEIVGARLK